MRVFKTVFRNFLDQFSATLHGKYENDQILVDVSHVEGLAVPMDGVVGLPLKFILI